VIRAGSGRARAVDAGGGWLIFALPPAEVAAHPDGGESRHELYLMCDDIGTDDDELAKGVEFTREISDEGFGLVTALLLPDSGELAIYEPRHTRARCHPGAEPWHAARGPMGVRGGSPRIKRRSWVPRSGAGECIESLAEEKIVERRETKRVGFGGR